MSTTLVKRSDVERNEVYKWERIEGAGRRRVGRKGGGVILVCDLRCVLRPHLFNLQYICVVIFLILLTGCLPRPPEPNGTKRKGLLVLTSCSYLNYKLRGELREAALTGVSSRQLLARSIVNICERANFRSHVLCVGRPSHLLAWCIRLRARALVWWTHARHARWTQRHCA